MQNNERRVRLKEIIDDPHSTVEEVTEARQELNETSPATQAQEDTLLENMLRHSWERSDPRYCDDEIVNLNFMLGARILSTCNDPQHIEILAALFTRTKSTLVRDNVIREMQHIAEWSPVEAIRQLALTFLADHDLDQPSSRNRTGPSGPCFGCWLRQRSERS